MALGEMRVTFAAVFTTHGTRLTMHGVSEKLPNFLKVFDFQIFNHLL
jgi:hypothetical protein